MKSKKSQSEEKIIDIENIPTQINENSKEKNTSVKVKENFSNSRYVNNIPKHINYIYYNDKYFQTNNTNFNNKKEKELNKKNSINVVNEKKIIKRNGNKNIHLNKSRSIDVIPGKINNNNQHKNKNINHYNNPINKSESIIQSSNNKIKQKEENSIQGKYKNYSQQNRNKTMKNLPEKTISSDIKKSDKEISSALSSNKKNKDCFSSTCIHNININNDSIISGISCTKSMIAIENSIHKMYEWEKRRKEKIEKMRNTKEKQVQKYTYIPKINKRSNSLAEKLKSRNKKKENIFERLSKEDKIIKEKKKILADLYTPSFHPKITYSNRKGNSKYNKSNQKNKKKENDELYMIRVNKINHMVKLDIPVMDDDIHEEEKKNVDDHLQNILRKTIIKNMSNKLRNKSSSKRKSHRDFL